MVFQRDADASAKAFGMGPIPRVEVPLVYNNITTDQAIEQTDPVVDEIMELLTKWHHRRGNRESGSAGRAGEAVHVSRAKTSSGRSMRSTRSF